MGSNKIHVKHYKVRINNKFNVKHFKTSIVPIKSKKGFRFFICVILFILLFSVAIYSFSKIVLWKQDSNKTEKQIESISEDVVIDEVEDNENTELFGEDNSIYNDYWYYVKFPLINVNFNELKQKNSDTVAWINVNNTNINYPVVQADDNQYYLNHSFNKDYNEAGWVFLDFRNNPNFSDKNTVIYAHSRLDKTMFGSLSKTLHQSWYLNKDNHIIRISNEYENSLWQIFSVYKIETEDYYITTSFLEDSDYQEFLNTMVSRSIYNFNTQLTTNDRIITLSTCYDDTKKTVVHAKLLKRELRQ